MGELSVPDFGTDFSNWEHVAVDVSVDVGHYVVKFETGDVPVPYVIQKLGSGFQVTSRVSGDVVPETGISI